MQSFGTIPSTAASDSTGLNTYDRAESLSELYPGLKGRERLHLSTKRGPVSPWNGQPMGGTEIALALSTTPAIDHRPPEIISAAACNGPEIALIASADLVRFLQAHADRIFSVANAGRIFWLLFQACKDANAETEFLWRMIGWRRFNDVVLLDLLQRLPLIDATLMVPRSLFQIAGELAGVHALPTAPRELLLTLQEWRSRRAGLDPNGFVAAESQVIFLAAQLLQQLLLQPPAGLRPEFLEQAQGSLGDQWMETLQRLLTRAAVARQFIYVTGIACDAQAVQLGQNMAIYGVNTQLGKLRKNPATRQLFGRAGEPDVAFGLHVNGDILLRIMAKARQKYPDLPDIPAAASALALAHPQILNAYGDKVPALNDWFLLSEFMRRYHDVMIGSDGRLHLRYVSLPLLRRLPDAATMQINAPRVLPFRISAGYTLLLFAWYDKPTPNDELNSLIMLSAALELMCRGYRVVLEHRTSFVLEVPVEQADEAGQQQILDIVNDYIGLHLPRPDTAGACCVPLPSWEEAAPGIGWIAVDARAAQKYFCALADSE